MKQANQDISKLPKWAQNKINMLESNIQYYKDQVDALTSKKETPFSFGYPEKKFISTNSLNIATKTGDYSLIIRKEGDLDYLEISCGTNTLGILPQASNVIRLKEIIR